MCINTIHLRSTEEAIDSVLRAWPSGARDLSVETSTKRRVKDSGQFECLISVYFSATPRAVQEIVGLLMTNLTPGVLWLNLDREIGQWRYTLLVLEDQTVRALPTKRDPHWTNKGEQPNPESSKPDSFWVALKKDLLFDAFVSSDGSVEHCEVREVVPTLRS